MASYPCFGCVGCCGHCGWYVSWVVKPLYNLLLGVMESLKAMQWVMLLTLLTLYAGAITWTSLVGKKMLPDPPSEELRHDAEEYFGTVPDSLFSLFKLMNGDTDVVACVTHGVYGQLLFAAFMILSNWAVLAILTSVVSDNMISSSAKAAEEERRDRVERDRDVRRTCLNSIFRQLDKAGNNVIDEVEWQGLKEDQVLFQDLQNATGLNSKGLQEVFDCASTARDPEDITNLVGPSFQRFQRVLTYEAYMDALEEESAAADKQSVRNVILHLHGLERMIRHINSEVIEMRHVMNLGTPNRQKRSMTDFCLSPQTPLTPQGAQTPP